MQYHYQTNNYECGLRALQNAFITLGVDYIDRKDIGIVAGTNRQTGTSKRGIVRAAKYWDFTPTIYQTRNPALAWRWAYKWAARTPCIVLVDDMSHWATLSGTIEKKVMLIDPTNFNNNMMGTYCLDKEELLDRWVGGGVYYAVRITRG